MTHLFKTMAFICALTLGSISMAQTQMEDAANSANKPKGPWVMTYVLGNDNPDGQAAAWRTQTYIEINEGGATKAIIKDGNQLSILEGTYTLQADELVLTYTTQSVVAWSSDDPSKVFSDPRKLVQTHEELRLKVRKGKFSDRAGLRDQKNQPLAANAAVLEGQETTATGKVSQFVRAANAYEADVSMILKNADQNQNFAPPTRTP